jgi:hypothetical protein
MCKGVLRLYYDKLMSVSNFGMRIGNVARTQKGFSLLAVLPSAGPLHIYRRRQAKKKEMILLLPYTEYSLVLYMYSTYITTHPLA